MLSGCGGGGSIAIIVIIALVLVLATGIILVWWGHHCCHYIGVMGQRWCWCWPPSLYWSWWGHGVEVIVTKLALLGPSSLSSCWCWCRGPSLLLSHWVMGPHWPSSSWWCWWDRCRRCAGAGVRICHCRSVVLVVLAVIVTLCV